MIRVAVYTRVSTQEQAREGYSIREQAERLKKLCEAHGWIVHRVYSDPGFSGASTERPALQELLSDIRAGKIDKVLVYKLDRLSRSQKDTLRLIEDEFVKNGVDFESMTENLDTGTPHGRAMIGILAAFAQLEREQIKERMKLGAEARAKEGKWRGGGQLPFGYSYTPGDNFLKVNPEEAELVQMIFRKFTSGTSINTLRKLIGKERRQFQLILANRTYLGELRCRDKWLPGGHEPIIDAETFERAQEILAENRRRWEETRTRAGASLPKTLLTGILFCKRCGAKYCKRKIHVIDYYACCSRAKKSSQMVIDPNCKNKSWRVADLDALVIGEIKKLRFEPLVLEQKTKKDTLKDKNAISRRITALSRQIGRLMDLYALGEIETEEISAKIKPLEEERKSLRAELEQKPARRQKKKRDIKKLIDSFEEALKNGVLEEKRAIIQQLIDRIEIDGDDVSIFWNF